MNYPAFNTRGSHGVLSMQSWRRGLIRHTNLKHLCECTMIVCRILMTCRKVGQEISRSVKTMATRRKELNIDIRLGSSQGFHMANSIEDLWHINTEWSRTKMPWCTMPLVNGQGELNTVHQFSQLKIQASGLNYACWRIVDSLMERNTIQKRLEFWKRENVSFGSMEVLWQISLTTSFVFINQS